MSLYSSSKSCGEVDLVNFTDRFSAFIFDKDQIYKDIPDESKHYTIEKHVQDLKNGKKPSHFSETGVLDASNFFKKLIGIHWKHSIDFSLVDVGSSYGLLSMEWGAFIKKHGYKNKIYAFDCGQSSDLCPYNFKLNLLDDVIHFERKAVSNFSVPQQVFFDPEHTEDNHINKREGTNLQSYVVDGITLDDYFQNHKENLLIKIDTQGVEPLVFEGMQKIMTRKPIIIFEFTPWVISSLSLSPVEFLNSIPDDYAIFNLNTTTKMVHPLKKDDLESFVKKLSDSKTSWTDLFIVPKSFIGYEDIINELEKAENYSQ